MLSENIKIIRKSKGLSQEELAVKLHVVRQTVSKWEKGHSVPDSEMLVRLSEELETPVNILLGETIVEAETKELKVIAEKLEVINLQLAQKEAAGRKRFQWMILALIGLIAAVFVMLYFIGSPYLNWDYQDPELAVTGVLYHGFEWMFVRTAPVVLGILIIILLKIKVKEMMKDL